MLRRLSITNKPLFTVICVSVLLVAACSKDNVVPELEDSNALANEYEIEKFRYFLAEEDEIDTVKLEFDPEEFYNRSSNIVKHQYIETFDNLFKTSVFQLERTGNDLPADLDLSQFKVSVPAHYHENGGFSYYSQRFFMSESLQKDAYTFSTSTATLTVPAHTKFIFSSGINRQDMTCSFEAIIRNKTTGETYTVTGKWKGVLRYFNSFIRVDEEALD